jgi:hypothetical protein
VTREVCVRCDLPARDVDRLETSLDHLHGLGAGKSAECGDVLVRVHELPQALCAQARERVLDAEAAADALDVVLCVRALDARPSSVQITCAHLTTSRIQIVCNLDRPWILKTRSDGVNASYAFIWDPANIRIGYILLTSAGELEVVPARPGCGSVGL